jgi:uncharacterized membrane protein YkvA (DUF1232 family)
MAAMIDKVKDWARALKRNVVALWFACKDARTPPLAKALAVFTVGYALSPIDLIPDFIPVLGFLDDAIILPGLIWLVLRMVPGEVLADSRAQADAWFAEGRAKPASRVGAVVIILVWIAGGAWLWMEFGRRWF